MLQVEEIEKDYLERLERINLETETKLRELQEKIAICKQSKVMQLFEQSKFDSVFKKLSAALPDERITQAEYEKVVKGARLTDPVEEPISRSCTSDIIGMYASADNKPVFACWHHLHSLDADSSETTLISSKRLCDDQTKSGTSTAS